MKQRQRLTRLLPPLLLIFLLCLLCGCSVRQPDTRLTLNPDGSGERVINCVIANNGLSEKIDGGEAAPAGADFGSGTGKHGDHSG